LLLITFLHGTYPFSAAVINMAYILYIFTLVHPNLSTRLHKLHIWDEAETSIQCK